jgi:outer membrane receptor for ferric coprogen and ferric-rhodotorulic acid
LWILKNPILHSINSGGFIDEEVSSFVSYSFACQMVMSGNAFAQGNSQSASATQEAKEIIVTGVFAAKAAEKAPISINVVTSKDLAQQVAASSADLLKNVPGVFVNSALGEIRNVVFSRGISANSLDGAGGYYASRCKRTACRSTFDGQQLWPRLLPALGYQPGRLEGCAAARR